jgi:hypothetical protein
VAQLTKKKFIKRPYLHNIIYEDSI